MKNLITILLVSFVIQGMAQDSLFLQVYEKKNLYQDSTSINYHGFYSKSMNSNDLIIDALFKNFFEYQKDCYNDSIPVIYDFYLYDNDTIKFHPSIDPGFCPGYLGRWVIYEHKEPTLSDFIEWLKNKKK